VELNLNFIWLLLFINFVNKQYEFSRDHLNTDMIDVCDKSMSLIKYGYSRNYYGELIEKSLFPNSILNKSLKLEPLSLLVI
jgi:hypothetical protein